jgi:hypothetical protein
MRMISKILIVIILFSAVPVMGKPTLVPCDSNSESGGGTFNVKTDKLNVHAGPGYNYSQIADRKASREKGETVFVQLDPGMLVVEECRVNGWSRVLSIHKISITTGAIGGWVDSRFLDAKSVRDSTKGNQFLPAEEEAQRLATVIDCQSVSINSATANFGKLYSCIQGQGETVKTFLNEAKGTGQVNNIKFLWNDWTKPPATLGYSPHIDQDVAEKAIDNIVLLYAPEVWDLVRGVFFSDEPRKIIRTEIYTITYTYHRGPAMDERMIVIKQRAK